MKLTPEGIAVLSDDTHISRWVEKHKRLDHDQATLSLILPYIGNGDVVVDGGACIGDHTIAYLEAVGETGRVLAFEPNPLAYECLCYNCPDATNYPLALGDFTGAIDYLPSENAGAGHVAWRIENGASRVPIIELDLFRLNRLDFMKLDLEGYEYQALVGAKATLNICRPVLVIEINNTLKHEATPRQDLFALLDKYGYDFAPLFQNHKLTDEQTDILCTPRP